MNGLLRDGSIRHDPEGLNGTNVRLRVFRDDDGNFYVKTNQGTGLSLANGNIAPATPLAADITNAPANRAETTTYRILRDTELARKVKLLHDYRCQICGYSIKLPSGLQYAEAHHIQQLGEPHNGPDVLGNIICVCPDHHAELDYCTVALTISSLTHVADHPIDRKYVDYHNQIFSQK